MANFILGCVIGVWLTLFAYILFGKWLEANIHVEVHRDSEPEEPPKIRLKKSKRRALMDKLQMERDSGFRAGFNAGQDAAYVRTRTVLDGADSDSDDLIPRPQEAGVLHEVWKMAREQRGESAANRAVRTAYNDGHRQGMETGQNLAHMRLEVILDNPDKPPGDQEPSVLRRVWMQSLLANLHLQESLRQTRRDAEKEDNHEETSKLGPRPDAEPGQRD